jgi:hypothetical protein
LSKLKHFFDRSQNIWAVFAIIKVNNQPLGENPPNLVTLMARKGKIRDSKVWAENKLKREARLRSLF